MYHNPNLRTFWEDGAGCRIRILKGGRISSKTWEIGTALVVLASMIRCKILCLRQLQNKIAESVHALLASRIDELGYTNEYDIKKTSIVHLGTGSEFHFYGIQRNIREIKGFEGADVCWIEEAEGLTQEQFEVIEPTIRKQGSFLILTYNPNLVTDFVETFKHDPKNGIYIRHINYDENPYISNTSLKSIERLKSLDYDAYEHVYLGVPRSDDEKVIIKRSWIEASIDAHIKLKFESAGKKRIGFDIADAGGDRCCVVYAHGSIVLDKVTWRAKEDELLKSCSKTYRIARKYNAEITYDAVGVGASAGNKFSELNTDNNSSVKFNKFLAGSKVTNPDKNYMETTDKSANILNKDFFSNIKAQSWWLLADRFRNTYNAINNGEKFNNDELISISSKISDLETLITELSTPFRDFDTNSRVKVESKEQLLKRGIQSTDEADALVMAFSPQKQKSLGWYEVDL